MKTRNRKHKPLPGVGAEAAIALRQRPSGSHPDKRQKRCRTRSAAKKRAISEG